MTWTAPAALNTNAATDSGFDSNPQLTTDGLGNWTTAWASNDSLAGTIGTDNDILVARSTDAGATWTGPVALNVNAATDSGQDSAVRLSVDSGGTWMAVWHSDETLGGTIGNDSDVLEAQRPPNQRPRPGNARRPAQTRLRRLIRRGRDRHC